MPSSACPLVAAPTDEEAHYLASSLFQRVIGILTGKRGLLPPPRESYLDSLSPQEMAGLQQFLSCAVIGSPDTVRNGLQQLLDATQADEMMLVCDVFDPALRLRALDLAVQARG